MEVVDPATAEFTDEERSSVLRLFWLKLPLQNGIVVHPSVDWVLSEGTCQAVLVDPAFGSCLVAEYPTRKTRLNAVENPH